MSQKLRKLAGTIMLLVLVTIYSLLVMVLAGAVLPRAGNKLIELLFFVVAGLAWVPAAALIVSWMHRAPR